MSIRELDVVDRYAEVLADKAGSTFRAIYSPFNSDQNPEATNHAVALLHGCEDSRLPQLIDLNKQRLEGRSTFQGFTTLDFAHNRKIFSSHLYNGRKYFEQNYEDAKELREWGARISSTAAAIFGVVTFGAFVTATAPAAPILGFITLGVAAYRTFTKWTEECVWRFLRDTAEHRQNQLDNS